MKKVKLGEVCEILSGYAFKSSQFNDKKIGLPLIRIRDVERGFSDTYFEGAYPEEYLIKNGDLLITMDGSFILKKWEGDLALLNQRVCKIKITDKSVDEGYIAWLIPKFLKEIEDKTPFVTVKHLSVAKIKDISFVLPNKLEQKLISKRLNTISQIYDFRKIQSEGLNELVKSRFNEMFGDIFDTTFPIYRLEELCEFIKDGTHQTPQYTDDRTNGFKFLSSKDVTSGKISWDNIKYITESLHNELYAKISPRRNDILLAKNGTTGIAALVDCDEIFDIYVSLAILRFYDGNNPTYLLYAINSDATKWQFESSLKGVGVPNLHLREIRKTKIPLPPLSLQNEFEDFVAKIDKSQLAIQKSLEELETLKKSLMQEYFG